MTLCKTMLRTGAVAAALLSAACTGPMPQLPPSDIPATWEQSTAATAWPSKDWWQTFNSADLNLLMATVEEKNLDIAAAKARLLQAMARAKQADAGLFPTLNLNGAADHQIGVNASTTAHDSVAGINLGAAYELDVFGKNRAASDAAGALLNVSQADQQTVRLTIIADTANTYFLLLSLRERLTLAQSNLKAAQDFAGIVQQRVDRGFVPAVDLAQQRTVVAAQASLIAQLKQQELEARNLLSLLLGRTPEGFDVASHMLTDLAVPQPAPGMTSELLLRRPDITAAEANLKAGHADLAAARAAFFPTISLTGSAGYSSPALAGAITTLPGPGGLFSFGASLVQVIFDAGKLQAKSDEACAREDELLANYRKSVIAGFADVENALGAMRNLDELEKAQIDLVEQSTIVFDSARSRYDGGYTDYLTTLEAQRTLFSARDQLNQTRLARLQAIVALYKALGGGWRSVDVASE